jgi:hypothetical protein
MSPAIGTPCQQLIPHSRASRPYTPGPWSLCPWSLVLTSLAPSPYVPSPYVPSPYVPAFPVLPESIVVRLKAKIVA